VQLAENNVIVKVTNAARKYLAEKGYDRNMGARPLARLIQHEVKRPLSEEVLFGALENGGKATIDYKDDQIVIKCK
jgi:ATP-dependent Clp protease ATP-binding subunit ClpA